MTRETPTDASAAEAARTVLEADALHEGTEGAYIDCPECGSPAYLADIVTIGRCTGYQDESVDGENAEAVGEFCTAKLSLELVYREEP
jgi:hypothetical protein